MTHWAEALIGKPWAPRKGKHWMPGHPEPAAFDCWDLVRYGVWRGYEIELPPLARGDEGEGVGALKRAAKGWEQSSAPPVAGDIVFMDGVDGRHVGLMVAVRRGLRLLHCDGCMTAHGPSGSVCLERLSHVLAARYSSEVELWRRKA